MNIAWTIAASDSSGGAGIEADLAAFARFNIHGCAIITKITAQNTKQIDKSYTVPLEIFRQQINTLNADLKPQAIKISVLGDTEQLFILSSFLEDYEGYIVYDPVFISSTGTVLTDNNLVDQIKNKLLPQITLLTPNIPEAELLTGIKINTSEDIIIAAQIILNLGVQNVLLKGGHADTEYASDFFINNQQSFWLTNNKTKSNIHGTGCHLSSAITANLALGYNISDSVIIAKRYISSAIRNSYKPIADIPQNYIPQFNFTYNNADMPILNFDYSRIKSCYTDMPFLDCGNLGLYAIVDNSDWVLRLSQYGVKTIQLRIKDLDKDVLDTEIVKSVAISRQYQVKLFINDYWQLAIKHKAYGVHLGQDDLHSADIMAIKNNGLRLGISSHSHYELAIAIGYKPSYIALGPIYPTTSKIMPWQPQGLQKVKEWMSVLNCTLVVIGGIGLDNIDEVLSTGVKNIAMISAITKSSNPYETTQILLKKCQ
jgi:hydroxymethylpyrimidine kinase/phosphomethylpyrimidine kinase/thiamine-phosphate diphosphorylase